MKRFSIRAKLTLLYTLLSTIIVCIILGILFSLGEQQILTNAKHTLEERVSSSLKEIHINDGKVKFDSELMELEDGVYLSVYNQYKELLYGRIPYVFSNDSPLENGYIREITSNHTRYYVMDISTPLNENEVLYVRGILSLSKTESTFYNVLRLALILLPLFILLTAVIGYFMAKKALSPVYQITNTVQSIQKEKDLSRRIHLGNGKDEIYHLANTFDELLDQVEDSIKREQQFTSDVSHELRTPLSVISMQCDALLDTDNLDETIREKLLVIHKKTRILTNMLSQLLLLSRADQGREKLHMERLNFTELCEMAIEECQLYAKEKNISITHEIVENIQIYGDQTLLIRLWMNLLNNALQYGKENGHIHVSLTSHDGYIYGSVEDDGCGIHEKDLPYIWNRFYQADSARSNSESSGLGLSMVKWIIEVHHGVIHVESTLHKGTKFFFEISQKNEMF